MRINTEEIVPRYLALALQVAGEFEKFSRSNRASIQRIKALTIQIPADKREQQRIVGIVESIEEEIAKAKGILTELQAKEQQAFIDIFGDTEANTHSYQTQSIGSVLIDSSYGTSKPATENGQYLYLRMNNITDGGELDLSDLKRIDIDDDEAEKCIVKNGDVLFNRTNSLIHVGKTCVFNDDREMVIAGYIIRLRLNSTQMLPVFFSELMNLPYMKKRLRGIAVGAINQANINPNELKKLLIVNPPMPQQIDFSKIVEQISKQKAEVRLTISKLNEKRIEAIRAHF